MSDDVEWESMLDEAVASSVPEWPASGQDQDESISRSAMTGKKRGRPKGHLGSALLRQELLNQDTDQEAEAPVPYIVRAREARARNVAARKEERQRQQQQVVAAATAGHGATSSTSVNLDGVVPYGPNEIAYNVGEELHQDMVRAFLKCCQQNPDNPLGSSEGLGGLVQHQLDSAMTTMSARALEEKVNETGIGNRVISIASAMLEYCAYLWALLLSTLQRSWSKGVIKPIAFICAPSLR